MANPILVKKVHTFIETMRQQNFTDEDLADAFEEVLPDEIGRSLSPQDDAPNDEQEDA